MRFRPCGIVRLLAGFALVNVAGCADVAAPAVARFAIFEIELTSARTYDNPFLDVGVAAELTAPDDNDWTLLVRP
jgi:hypothetical protein